MTEKQWTGLRMGWAISQSKNKVFSEEYRRKISLAHRGRKLSSERREKLRMANLGRRQSLEERQKRSIIAKNLGIRPPVVLWTQERRERVRSILSGEKNPNWKGGYERKLWNNRKRRILMLGNGGSHSFEEWQAMKKHYSFTCPACLKREPEITLTVDHIIPLRHGGTDNISNIQPLCGKCNAKKYSKLITAYCIPNKSLADGLSYHWKNCMKIISGYE